MYFIVYQKQWPFRLISLADNFLSNPAGSGKISFPFITDTGLSVTKFKKRKRFCKYLLSPDYFYSCSRELYSLGAWRRVRIKGEIASYCESSE